MKRKMILMGVLLVCCFSHADAQALELISFVTNKVVKAIDLKVQEMQNSVLVLQNIQRKAENELSRQQLSEIATLDEKQKELYRDYFASLRQVKPVVGSSARVRKIIEEQKQLVALYNMVISEVKPDTHLTEKEKTDFIANCTVILQDSYTTIRKLNEALQSNRITATDVERLKLINQSANQVDVQYNRLQILLTRCRGFIDARLKLEQETLRLKKSYGL